MKCGMTESRLPFSLRLKAEATSRGCGSDLVSCQLTAGRLNARSLRLSASSALLERLPAPKRRLLRAYLRFRRTTSALICNSSACLLHLSETSLLFCRVETELPKGGSGEEDAFFS